MESQKNTKLTEMRIQEEKFEKHLATVLKKLPFASECDLSKQPDYQSQMAGPSMSYNTSNPNTLQYVQMQNEMLGLSQADPEVEFVSSHEQGDVINVDVNESRSSSRDRNERYNRRRRTSRSRSPRDRVRGGRRRSSRSRSRSRSPRLRRRTDREKEKEREYERERRRKGLPDVKKDHLSVCTTTLWVGHLSKLVQQEELSDTFGKYGDIVSIDMIPPRGCAFIVMNRRQDAHRSMQGLKGHKMHNRAITVSWAAGKGVKSKEWKDFWDLELGVSYIPCDRLDRTTDFAALEEGGMFDEDTIPTWMKEAMSSKHNNSKEDPIEPMPAAALVPAIDTTQPPPLGQMISMVPPFPMGAVQRLMAPMGIPLAPPMAGVPMLNVPPPGMLMGGK